MRHSIGAFFFFQADDGIRDGHVTGVQTCALPISIRCGWSDLDVFGCHPTRPDARFDCMGLVLLLDRVEVVGVDEHGADLETSTGARQRYRRRPLPDGTVSLWE